MEERKTLELVFRNEAEQQVKITVYDPTDGLSLATVQTAAGVIIEKNIFTSKGGDLVELVEARIRVISVTDLA